MRICWLGFSPISCKQKSCPAGRSTLSSRRTARTSRTSGLFCVCQCAHTKNTGTKFPLSRYGAGNVTRTHDLLITNQLLYRLSYTSKLFFHSRIYVITLSPPRQSPFLLRRAAGVFHGFSHLFFAFAHNRWFTVICPVPPVHRCYPHLPQLFPQPPPGYPQGFQGFPRRCAIPFHSLTALPCKIVYIIKFPFRISPPLPGILQSLPVENPAFFTKLHPLFSIPQKQHQSPAPAPGVSRRPAL